MSSGAAVPDGNGPATISVRQLPGMERQVFEDACPHLGLSGDPTSRCTFVTEMHRCHRTARPRPVPLDVQARLCLAASFERCPVYQGTAEGFGDAPRRALPIVPMIAGVLILLLVIAGSFFLTRPRSGSDSAVVAEVATSTAPTPTVGQADSAVPSATSAVLPGASVAPPVATATAAATPSPSPSIAPSPVPSPSPAAAGPSTSVTVPRPATHLVQVGESISAIAARYGLNPVALSELNDIPWNATIFPGQVLRLQ